MEEKKVGSILLLFKACHWTLCHINAGASSSSVVKHCARVLCLLLCLFWTELGISCTFRLQPTPALISIANKMWFLCSSPPTIRNTHCPCHTLHGLFIEVPQQVVGVKREFPWWLLCAQPQLCAQGPCVKCGCSKEAASGFVCSPSSPQVMYLSAKCRCSSGLWVTSGSANWSHCFWFDVSTLVIKVYVIHMQLGGSPSVRSSILN